MIDNIPLTLESIVSHDRSIVDIYEVNSGYHSHKQFPVVLNDIMEKIESKFYKLKKFKISELTTSEYTINHEIGYLADINDPSSTIKKNIRIQFKSVCPTSEQLKSKTIVSGETYLQNKTFDIEIGINCEKTVGDINTNTLEMVLSHELVHIFQNLYDNHRKTMAYYNKLHTRKNDDMGIFGNPKYWTSKSELEAYTSQINTELKNIKKENPDMKFNVALLKTDGWRLLYKNLNSTNHPALKRILSKVIHYWQHSLGGKINEHKIKLTKINEYF